MVKAEHTSANYGGFFEHDEIGDMQCEISAFKIDRYTGDPGGDSQRSTMRLLLNSWVRHRGFRVAAGVYRVYRTWSR
jgi:hypothetical protein